MVKSRKKRKFEINDKLNEDNDEKIPIKNLPSKCLIMKINSGSKIRNILKFAFKEFSKFNCIIWTGAGQAIGKIISCSEIFKAKNNGLHQITKLRYIDSKKKAEDDTKNRQVPEIFILLSKNILDTSEPGYQGPEDVGMFQNSTEENKFKTVELMGEEQGQGQRVTNRMPAINPEEFIAMGLRMNLKRPRQERDSKIQMKKNKN